MTGSGLGALFLKKVIDQIVYDRGACGAPSGRLGGNGTAETPRPRTRERQDGTRTEGARHQLAMPALAGATGYVAVTGRWVVTWWCVLAGENKGSYGGPCQRGLLFSHY